MSGQFDQKINYDDAVKYWSSQEASVNGVLGGFGNTVVPRVDIIGSNAFFKRLAMPDSKTSNGKYALDIGAGIGRVTRDFLVNIADKVDVLEPAGPLIEQAKKELGPHGKKIGEYYEMGMQDFIPEEGKYWLIWCQWCLGQLGDEALKGFLKRCIKGLQPGGMIVVKENNTTTGEDDFDDQDSSVTRSDENFRKVFADAGLQLVLKVQQKGMPKELFPVRMYGLKPKIDDDSKNSAEK